MILDRDRGRQLIDMQAQFARIPGEQRVIRRKGRVRRKLQVPAGARAGQQVGGAAFMSREKARNVAAAGRRLGVAKFYPLKVGVELDGMRVGRDPVFTADELVETRPDMQVVLEKAGVAFDAVEELPPGASMACQACQLEAGKAFRGRRLLCSVNRGDARERDVNELAAHVRKAVRMPVEVEDVDLHRVAAAGSDLHLRAEFDHPIGRQVEEVGSARGLLRHRDEELVLPQRHAGSGSCLRVRRPRKNEVVMMSNLRPAFRAAASARGICGCSI